MDREPLGAGKFGRRAVTPEAQRQARTAKLVRVTSQSPKSPAKGWQFGLIINAEGNPKAVSANALHALREAPQFQGVLGYNEMTGEPTMQKPAPWDHGTKGWRPRRWTDNDDRLLAECLQHERIMVSDAIAGQAAETIAREHPFHPVRDYLGGLTWDGAPRLDGWLSKYLGAPDDPYTRAVGPRWLISGVARVFYPGSQVDCMLILEGPQGAGKSSVFQVLGGGLVHRPAVRFRQQGCGS